MKKEFTIRKANRNDLSRIAEIQVFNYRLYFYPIFKSDSFLLGYLDTQNRKLIGTPVDKKTRKIYFVGYGM